jgi:hypothetical protein
MPDYWGELMTGNRGNPLLPTALKIKRANRHISEIETASRELPKRRAYHFVVGKPAAGKLNIQYLAEAGFLPVEFSGALGDAVHNLRSAFDHIAIAFAAPPLGTGNPKNIYFPTGADRRAFVAELGRKMKGASPDALRVIEELEPYDGGQHSLRALHELDIMDKHKLLIPAIARMRVERMSAVVAEKEIALGGADFQSDGGNTFTATIDCPRIERYRWRASHR